MARLATSGFEFGQFSATQDACEGEGFVCQGTLPTVESTIVRPLPAGGAASKRSMKLPAAVGTCAPTWLYTPTITRTYYARFGFYLAAGTITSQVDVATIWDASNQLAEVLLDTSGRIRFNSAITGATGALSSALSRGAWHLIELSWKTNAGASGNVYEMKVDGVSLGAQINSSGGNTPTQFRLGKTTATTSGIDIYYDDFGFNDDQGSDQNTWLGDGYIVMSRPTADLSRGADWFAGTATTTNLWDALNNTPAVGVVSASGTAASQVRDAVAANTQPASQLDLTMESYTAAGVPSGSTVKLVAAVMQVGSNSATATNAEITILSNPVQATPTAVNFGAAISGTSPTGWTAKRGATQYSPTVTLGTAPTMRIDKRTANARHGLVDLAGIYIEFTPPLTAAASDSVTPTESSTRTVSPQKADAATASEATAKTVKPGTKADTATATEVISKKVSPGVYAETVVSSDGSTRTVIGAKADTATASEANAKKVTLGKADTATASDLTAKLEAIAKADGVTASETTSKKVIKLSADAATAADQLSKLIHLFIADSASTADLATPVLTQGLITLSRSDTATASDQIAKFVGLAKADIATATELGFRFPQLKKSDSVTTSDSAIRTVFKLPADAVTASDTLAKLIHVFISDAALTGDLALPKLAATSISLADSVTASDQISKFAKIAAGDIAIATELGIRFPQLRKADAATASDSFDRTVSYKRTPADSVTASDVITLTRGRVITDNVTADDAISKKLTLSFNDTLTSAAKRKTIFVFDD